VNLVNLGGSQLRSADLSLSFILPGHARNRGVGFSNEYTKGMKRHKWILLGFVCLARRQCGERGWRIVRSYRGMIGKGLNSEYIV